MALQHFFIGPRYLGAREIDSYRRVPGLETRWHHSYCYYCIQCGEIWGRILHDKAKYHQLIQLPCAKHGGDGLLGCHPTWHDMPIRFEDNWPLDAIKYEFKASMAKAKKELEKT
jgi:hypothetical protein